MEPLRIAAVNELAWTRLGLILYIFAIVNLGYAFYSSAEQNAINAIISLATYLVLLTATTHIEDETR
jgi:hypothetical protein